MEPEKTFNYYYSLRQAARSKVVEALNAKVKQGGVYDTWKGLTLCSFEPEAYEYARREWARHYGDASHRGFVLSWERLYHQFTHRPAYFDLAIWQTIDGNRVLQALALGKPSNGKKHLTVNWVERSFALSYLKGGILMPILACAEEYAKLLGSTRVLIRNPVDPAKYIRYGYRPIVPSKRLGNCLEKEV